MAEHGADVPQDWVLHERETEVLALLEGSSDREIGEALKLSHDGVLSRPREIFAKLGAREARCGAPRPGAVVLFGVIV